MLRQLASLVGTQLGRRPPAAASATMPSWRATTTTSITQRNLSMSQAQAVAEPETLMIETEDGRTFRVLDSRRLPPLKPHIVKRRLSRMRTYIQAEKNIRHSPWRLNLICQMIAGLPVPEAIQQLTFCEKSRAPLVQEILDNATTKADKKDGVQPNQLEVAECFVTRGRPMKRIKPMARGRFGKMTRPMSHIRMVLREIDFKLRIYQAPTISGKKKWLNLQVKAEADALKAMQEREEMEKYMARQREIKEQEEKEN